MTEEPHEPQPTQEYDVEAANAAEEEHEAEPGTTGDEPQIDVEQGNPPTDPEEGVVEAPEPDWPAPEDGEAE